MAQGLAQKLSVYRDRDGVGSHRAPQELCRATAPLHPNIITKGSIYLRTSQNGQSHEETPTVPHLMVQGPTPYATDIVQVCL